MVRAVDAIASIGRDMGELGGSRIELRGLPVAWSIGRETDLKRYFVPHVVKKGTSYQILGSVGILCPPFEALWEQLSETYRVNDARTKVPLLSAFITNHPRFRHPVLVTAGDDIGVARQRTWLREIIWLAEQLPATLDALVSDLRRDAFGPFPASLSRGHWLKWAAFCWWLRESSYDLAFQPPNLEAEPAAFRALYDGLGI